MFTRSSDTTVNAGLSAATITSQLRDVVRNMLVHGEKPFIIIQEDVHDDHYILGYADSNDTRIKPFFNPITITNDEDTFLIVDVRTCARWDHKTNKCSISNPSLFRREVVRTVFEDMWVGWGSSELLNLGTYQITVFGTWLSEIISRRFGLDAEQQLRINALAAYYYLCLFTDEDKMDMRRAIPTIVKSCNLGAGFVIETLANVEYMSKLDDLVKTIGDVLQTERLSGFNLQVLIVMLSGSWFGANNATLVGIALEYPPTWNALMYLSLTDRVHRTNGIATVALRKERDNNTRAYVAACSAMLIQESSINPKDLRGGL